MVAASAELAPARDSGEAAAGWSCAPLDEAAAALHAAADAALDRRWDDTRAQLGIASERVRIVAQTAPRQFASALGPASITLRDLRQRTASSNPVGAPELRTLAAHLEELRQSCPAPP